MKNILRASFGALLIAGTSLLVVPEEASGWSTIGGSLGLSQRDFRIYDNFIDTASHNNTTADPNWPNYTEIELSAWKSGAEWGARVLGDGSGDPTQTQIGDGGGNFNFFWNGEASAVGGSNANILSPLGGSSGGVLAYCETPISDGWRIRFYESWTWDDGPGNHNNIDFQGVSCHELGHALGLGHSNVSQATMYAYMSGNGVADRSIHSDDSAGVQQGIYGAMSSNMPEITSLGGSLDPGGTCIINGSGFGTTGNEIWFNNDLLDSQQAGGDVTKLTGLASSNGGTQISFTVPSTGIEGGSLHVKVGTGSSALSEGEPFDYGGGVPGLNTISLSGPTLVFPGSLAVFNVSNAPANSQVYMIRSFNLNGSTIMGHIFDLGRPWFVVTNTAADASGNATFSLTTPNASGLTVNLEIGTQTAAGIFDSNPITVSIL